MKLSKIAYDIFKEKIFEGKIKLGSKIKQAELVKIVGVPTVPLREALQKLELEGYITINPRSGIYIFTPDIKMFSNAFQLRKIIELEALNKYFEKDFYEEIISLEKEHIDLLKSITKKTDIKKLKINYLKLEKKFHISLINNLKNDYIVKVYNSTQEMISISRFSMSYKLSPNIIKISIKEHMIIINSIKKNDNINEEKNLILHLNNSLHRSLGI